MVGRYIISHLISPLLFAEVQCLRQVFQRDGIKVIRKIKMDGRGWGGGYKDRGLTRYNPRSVQPLADMCHARNISISTVKCLCYTEVTLKVNLVIWGVRNLMCKLRSSILIITAFSGQSSEMGPC